MQWSSIRKIFRARRDTCWSISTRLICEHSPTCSITVKNNHKLTCCNSSSKKNASLVVVACIQMSHETKYTCSFHVVLKKFAKLAQLLSIRLINLHLYLLNPLSAMLLLFCTRKKSQTREPPLSYIFGIRSMPEWMKSSEFLNIKARNTHN